MSTTVNLRELVNERTVRPRGRRTPWLTRYLLPLGLVLGFVLVTMWSLRDSLLPATPVTVVPVLTTTSNDVVADAPLFRAAGWIEPRPTPVYVSALVEGVVERLLVVEGQELQVGEPVALLVRRDAEIQVQQAQADLALREAQLASAAAHRDAAEIYWAEPIERQAILSEAEAALAKIQTEVSRLPASIVGAEAKLAQSRKELDAKTLSQDAVARITVDRVRADVAIASAMIDELQAQHAALKNEAVALTKRRDILARQLKLKIEEERRLKESAAQYQAAMAQVRQAEAALSAAELRLDRTTVKAPITGKVLGIVARPGSKLMGLERAALTDASTVVTMYDPHRLQIRADVRLENVPKVQVGQVVRIETPAAGQPLRGRVLAITSLTDIQKNTLQVKIEIDDPSPTLKPDMLVEATFLAPPVAAGSVLDERGLRLMVPADLVDTSTQPPTVWVADIAARAARKKAVQIGGPLPDGMIEITAGLAVGDRLIASGHEPLSPDCRITIRGEAWPANASHASSHEQVPKTPQRLY